jgi:hypothetical protein
MLLSQSRDDLSDGPDVIGRVGGCGKSGSSTQVVPIRARGDDLPPLIGFVAETGAE